LTKLLAQKLNIPEGVLLKDAGQAQAQRSSFKTQEAEIKISASTERGQELLLALFLKDPAWVVSARDHIGPEDFSDGTARQVVDVIWSLANESGQWTTNDLLLRLNDESAQSVVTRLSSIEEEKLGDAALVFQDCIGKIRKEKQKKARGRLMEAIRQAEVLKDTEKLDQLREEFNQLLKISS
jgi:hypothetical protein